MESPSPSPAGEMTPADRDLAFLSPAGAETTGSEGEILSALARGDREAALRLLLREYGTPVWRYCRRMAGDGDLADEAHQMTFVQAYEGLPRFAGRSSLRTWLFGIAHHRCLDVLKISRRREARFAPLDGLPEPPAPAATAEDRLAAASRVRTLGRCLRELAPHVRAAVLLRFQQGITYEEMARLEGERAPTLQARVARALPVLRRCLESKGETP
jgi:RNA polymerase sigma-70 factor (ECF subfamily)